MHFSGRCVQMFCVITPLLRGSECFLLSSLLFGLGLEPADPFLTLWRPLLPYGYSYNASWASECPDVKNYKWRLNPVWHRMHYSCTHMATVGFKGLNLDVVVLYKVRNGFWLINMCLWNCCSPLVHLAMKTLQRFSVIEFFQIDEKVMLNWLQLIESKYHADNPYHNSTHAADVMHATAYFLNCEKLRVRG